MATTAHLLDIPILTTQDDDAGFYVAMGGPSGWRFAELYRSPDGVDYRLLLPQALGAIIGTATNERFILLDTAQVLVRVPDGLALRNVQNTYSAVSLFQPLSAPTPFTFTNTARGLQPYSLINLAATRSANA